VIGLVRDGPPELARLSDDLLGRIAGPQTPKPGLGAGGADERQKCHAAWQAWWQANAKQIEWAKLNLHLDADPELALLVEQAVRQIRDVLASNQHDDIKAERGRLYATLIAVYAQTGPEGARTPLRVTLRDAGLRLSRTINQRKFGEARKQLDGLATLNPDRQAVPGAKALLNGDVEFYHLMLSFSRARSGGLETERLLLKLQKDWARDKRIPDTLMNDELRLAAAHIARVTEAIQEYKPDKKQKEWLAKAEDARKAAVALGQTVRAGNGKEAYQAVNHVLNRCDSCHELFR
jgi:hypothetical protein